YIISPNTNVDVIARTKEAGMISIPGAFTATEIVTAWDAGADMVKLFPISSVGAEYLKQIKAPLDHVLFMASGGVRMDMVSDLAKAGFHAFGIGVQLLGVNAVTTMDTVT